MEAGAEAPAGNDEQVSQQQDGGAKIPVAILCHPVGDLLRRFRHRRGGHDASPFGGRARSTTRQMTASTKPGPR